MRSLENSHKLPRIRVTITIDRYYGPTTMREVIDIGCSDADQVNRLADLLTGMAETEKRMAETAETPHRWELPCPATRVVEGKVFYCQRKGHDDDNHMYASAPVTPKPLT
jgi:hypothetical protein